MIISCFLFISIFLSLIYSSNSIGISLLVASFFLCLTPIGETNIHIVIILASLLFCLYKKIFAIIPVRLMFLIAIITISTPSILISFDGDIYRGVGKILKIFVFLLPFTFSYKGDVIIETNKIIKSLAVLAIIFSFLWMSVRIYNGGFLFDNRISGLVLDPNYSVIVICSFFLMIYFNKNISCSLSIPWVVLFILVFLTQSISSITIFLVLFFFLSSVNKLKLPLRNNILFFILTSLILVYFIAIFYISINIKLSILSDWDSNYISMKINSLIMRLRAQIEGLRLITSDPIRILYGFGSQASVELFGRVMHNAYLQTLFNHGVILLICIYLFINIISIKYNFFSTIFYLQIMNFLFDNYFMGVTSLFFIIGLILNTHLTSFIGRNVKKNEKHICANVTV